MATRKVLKITPILIALNLLVLFLMVVFYSVRMVKYYLKENGNRKTDDVVLLVDTLKKKQSYLDETKGLVFNEETGVYTYKGEVDPQNPEEFIIHAEDGQKQRMTQHDLDVFFTELDVHLM